MNPYVSPARRPNPTPPPPRVENPAPRAAAPPVHAPVTVGQSNGEDEAKVNWKEIALISAVTAGISLVASRYIGRLLDWVEGRRKSNPQEGAQPLALAPPTVQQQPAMQQQPAPQQAQPPSDFPIPDLIERLNDLDSRLHQVEHRQ